MARKDKAEKKPAEPAVNHAAEEAMRALEMENATLKVQLKNLTDKANRLENDLMHHRKENERLKKGARDHLLEKREMFEQFKRDGIASEHKMRNMERELTEKENEIQKLTSERMSAIQQVVDNFTKEKEALLNELRECQSELALFSEFKEKKEAYERQIDDLVSERQKVERSLTDAMVGFAEHCKKEKDAAKRDALMKLEKTREKLIQITEQHMETRMKKTMQKNEQLEKDLEALRRQTTNLLNRNSKLQNDYEQLKRDTQLLRLENEEMIRKIQSQQMAIKLMTSRLNGVGSDIYTPTIPVLLSPRHGKVSSGGSGSGSVTYSLNSPTTLPKISQATRFS